jgi:cytochrome P450
MEPTSLDGEVSLASLTHDPGPAVARYRPASVVDVPGMSGWLVIGREAAVDVLRRDQDFTVDDPRFTTARVVGTSMLSLDGDEHQRHRSPFVAPFRRGALGKLGLWLNEQTQALAGQLGPHGRGELRTALAGPLAAATIHRALGFRDTSPATMLGWYRDIAAAVSDLSDGAEPHPDAAEAMSQLRATVAQTIESSPSSMLGALAQGDLTGQEIAQNTAVVLFGAIETAEGMIANALWHLLAHPAQLERVRADRSLVAQAIEESLRLEPAAAVVDRYATRATTIGDHQISRGELVRISLAAAGRDPNVFANPNAFDIDRADSRLHLAFAAGPHLCIGLLLARIETAAAIEAVLDHMPQIKLAADATPPSGLIFRKPQRLSAHWMV